TLTPDGRSVTTDQSGHFTITGVNAGTYTATASLATTICSSPVSTPVTMSGPQNITLTLPQHSDATGTTCADTIHTTTYVAATTVVSLAGDDAIAAVSTPFPVRYYGGTYSTAWLDTNGVIAFTNPGGSSVTWNSHVPSEGSPHNAVFPFWD